MDDEGKLRLRSLWLARLTMILFAATAMLILGPFLLGLRHTPWSTGTYLAYSAANWLPSVFYLYALWAIGRAFGAFGRGGTIGAAMARGCRRAGIALALGGTASAVGVPNILGALLRSGIIEGSRFGSGTILVFDIAYLAVGVVGLALFLLGGLLDRAGRVAAEAQALRTELGEFF
ncbi:MAG TPA: hypothetical protein VF552_06965 [Allosphingosinicella sp.]